MSIVITGATGQLSRLIVESLLERGIPAADITAAGRNVDTLSDLAARGVRVARIDFDDPVSLELAFAGASTVMLVSGTAVGRRVEQHSRVIAAAHKAGVSHVVYTSAPSADSSALILAPEHKATEQVLRSSGIGFTILRNGWYTENYLDQVRTAAQTGTIIGSAGDGRVASAPRRDYAEAAAIVLSTPGHEGKVYELSGDEAWHFDDLASTAAALVGRPVEYTAVSPEEHSAMLIGAGLPEELVGFIVALDNNTRDGLLAVTSGELGALIGRPTTPLREALAAAL